jgi:hypothetical protein
MNLYRWLSGCVATAVLLGSAAACTGSDDPKDQDTKRDTSSAPADDDGIFDGLYVGKLSGSDALVAVVASAQVNRGEREVTVFVCDGDKVVEWFRSSVPANEFTGESDDGDAEAEATIGADEATGTIKLSGGKTFQYEALRAAGASGLYDLTVTANGALRGATPAGVGATGKAAVKAGGNGTLKLADGRQIKFGVSSPAAWVKLTAGEARVIVLPDGRLAGVVERGQRDLMLSS